MRQTGGVQLAPIPDGARRSQFLIKSMTDMEAKKQAQIQLIKQQILAKQQGKPLMDSAVKSNSKMYSPLIG